MLRQDVADAALWSLGQHVGQRAVSAVVTLLLARILVPDDFGLIAMLAVFIAIATSLMDSGLTQALIQRKDATGIDLSTAFYAQATLGLVAYGLLWVGAPGIAWFYEEPRLTGLVRVVGLVVPFSSLQAVQVASLSRALDFKAQLRATLPANFLAGIAAVFAAYAGLGVWALVVQMHVSALLTAAFLWIASSWFPGRGFDRRSLGEMFGFGYKLFLSGVIGTVFRNLYLVVIGKLFEASLVGFYFIADRIRSLILHQLMSSIQKVTFPALSVLQDDDQRLKSATRELIRVTTFVVFPMMLFVAALAEPLFQALLPRDWTPAVLYLQLLCLAGLLYPLHVLNLNLLQVKGRSDLFLLLEVVKKILLTVVLVISIRFGVVGILSGQIVTSVVSYLPNSYFTAKLIGYPVREQLGDVLPAFGLASGVAGAAYMATEAVSFSPIVELLVFGAGAILFYLGPAWAWKLEALGLVHDLVRGRFCGSRAGSRAV